MANRRQRRAHLRGLKRSGRTPQGASVAGEVQFGVSVREGNVVMNLLGPHGESMVLGVPPQAARDFALALDEAAEAAENPEPDEAQQDGG
jgi:hypothetical protein